MRLLKTFACLLLACFALTQAAFAQSSHLDTPLMIVRFNQDRVYYEKPLYNAVSQALEAKPGVMFNLVSVVPLTSSASYNQKQDAVSKRNMGAFVGSMVNMGVPENRIRVQYQQAPEVEANEIQLYVE